MTFGKCNWETTSVNHILSFYSLLLFQMYFLYYSITISIWTDWLNGWLVTEPKFCHLWYKNHQFNSVHILITYFLKIHLNLSYSAWPSKRFFHPCISHFPIHVMYVEHSLLDLSWNIMNIVLPSQNSDGKHPRDYSAVQSVMGCWNGNLRKLC